MTMITYEIDGERFTTLDEFFEEVSRVIIPGAKWGHNLNAFNDILRGGFGTPPEGFIIRWKNHELSKKHLGYAATVQSLELYNQRCRLSERELAARELAEAKQGRGPTIYDELVEIIRTHCVGGSEQKDNVTLILE